MESYEIILALGAVATVLGAAYYEWRHTRTQIIENLEKMHEFQRNIDAIAFAIDSLEARAAATEEALQRLTELKPIAVRTRKT